MSSRELGNVTPESGRLFSPVKVDLAGRFMIASKHEYECRVIEMSTGAISFLAPFNPPLGHMVVVYISELGRFEGTVDRHDKGGFTIAMNLTETKHKKLAEQLVWFSNQEALDLPDARRHKRIVPLMQWTTVRLNNGKERMAKINDVSISGVNLQANISVLNVKLLVGGRVTVGSREATVRRIFDGGFVATFDNFLPEGEFNEKLRL